VLRGDFDAEMTRLLSKSQIVGVLKPLRDTGPVEHAAGRAQGVPSTASRLWIWLLEQDKSLWSTEIAIDASAARSAAGGCGPRRGTWRGASCWRASRRSNGGLGTRAALARRARTRGAARRDRLGTGALAAGSIFKLYVLAELARQVDVRRSRPDAVDRDPRGDEEPAERHDGRT
jgi:hypothetical protein